MSQNQRLLNYFEEHEGIHPLRAWNELGIYNLAAGSIYKLCKEVRYEP